MTPHLIQSDVQALILVLLLMVAIKHTAFEMPAQCCVNLVTWSGRACSILELNLVPLILVVLLMVAIKHTTFEMPAHCCANLVTWSGRACSILELNLVPLIKKCQCGLQTKNCRFYSHHDQAYF